MLQVDTLTIKIKLGPPRPSSTGRTNLLFSTGGFQPVAGQDGIKVNLMVTSPRQI